MQRITIISSIIAAVCVFQTAEAGFFNEFSFENQMSKLFGNQKNGQTIKSNPINCLDLYNDGSNIIDQVKTIFSTCFSDKINGTNTDIQHMNDALDELKANIAKVYKEVTKCNNFTTIEECLNNVYEKIVPVLTSSLTKVIKAATDVLHTSSDNMRECYEVAIQTSQDIINKYIAKVVECINSIKNLWHF